MNSRIAVQVMSHLRVLEVPSLMICIAALLNTVGSRNLFIIVTVSAIIRLFINIRFKVQQDRFQKAILNHLDDIIDDIEEDEDGV